MLIIVRSTISLKNIISCFICQIRGAQNLFGSLTPTLESNYKGIV